MVVIDPSEYEITVNIPAFDSGRIQVGHPVLLMSGSSTEQSAITSISTLSENGPTPASGDLPWTAKGKVFSVNPAVNPGGRSVQVRIRSEEGAQRLRDGMFVTSWIQVQNKEDAVVTPFNAFLYEENQPYFFVINKDNIADRREITVGI